MTRLLPILLVGLLLHAAAHPVQLKLDSIEQGRLRPGTHVAFPPQELNSWARVEADYWAPQSVRDLRLDLNEGRVTGFARIDFLKLKQAADSGASPGYFLRHMLAGERPVTVTARLESKDGQARVDVERVEISGVPLEGPALSFLIQTYLQATFPEARAGEWFLLDKHVDHFAVHPSGVTVVVK